MNPTIVLQDCEVLEVESRSYTGRDGTQKSFRAVLFRFKNKIFKLRLDNTADGDLLKEAVGSKSDLSVQLTTFGDKLEPSLSVLGIE